MTPAPVLTFCQRSLVADRARPLRSACADTCAICAPGELSGWHTERVLSHREIQSRWKTRSQQPGRTVHGSVGGDHAASAGRSSATPANVALGRGARSKERSRRMVASSRLHSGQSQHRSATRRAFCARVCSARAFRRCVVTGGKRSLSAGLGVLPVPVLNIKSGSEKKIKKSSSRYCECLI